MSAHGWVEVAGHTMLFARESWIPEIAALFTEDELAYDDERFLYVATAAQIRDRLPVLGFTVDRARADLAQAVRRWNSLPETDEEPDEVHKRAISNDQGPATHREHLQPLWRCGRACSRPGVRSPSTCARRRIGNDRPLLPRAVQRCRGALACRAAPGVHSGSDRHPRRRRRTDRSADRRGTSGPGARPGRVLDAEAGLSAIVRSARTAKPADAAWAERLRPVTNTGDLVEAVVSVPPVARLALRGPMRLYAGCLVVLGDLARVRYEVSDLVNHLGRLRFYDERDVHGFADAVGRVFDAARNLGYGVDHLLAQAHAWSRDFGADLPAELARDLDQVRTFAGTLDYRERHTITQIARARQLAHDVGTGNLDREFVADLDLDLDRARDRDRLWAALDDFTGADLSNVDLTGFDVGGVVLNEVRWSDGTRWPDSWAGWVTRNSVPLEDGVYVIRPGTATGDDRALVPR